MVQKSRHDVNSYLEESIQEEKRPPGRDQDGCGKHSIHEQRKHPVYGRFVDVLLYGLMLFGAWTIFHNTLLG
ncbi:MAG: hypothetical protein OXL96_16250 [Candidatus Poribacteria bacterium]|nr:hypothetical protein [Candidatus Poribacteria bacterium]